MKLGLRKDLKIYHLNWLVLVVVCVLPVWHSLSTSAYGQQIDRQDFKYEIKGNDKTRSIYIEALMDRCLEKVEKVENEVIKASLATKIRQCILNSRLFSEVLVTIDDQTIKVTVEERWTLIPLPLITADSAGNRKIGFFLLESNFLGLGKTIALGAFFTNVGHEFFMMYQDRNVFFSDWTFGQALGLGTKEIFVYDHKTKVDGFNEKNLFFMTTIGRNITDAFNLSLNIKGFRREYEQILDFHQRDSYKTMAIGPTFRLEKSNYHLFFNEGYATKVNYFTQVDRSDQKRSSYAADWTLSLENNVFLDHSLQVFFSAGYTDTKDERDLFRKGGFRGLRAIPVEGLWTSRLLSLSTDYQIPVRFASYGTYTIAPFMEFAAADRWLPEEDQKMITILSGGLGTYLYLKRVAIPGVGFHIGISNQYQPVFASMSVGLTMN